ncbi:1-acyl-sn-glycerol-3-phosphate acyltransferase [Candidatus Pacearchaeota archaeon]|nr:1-acyl-sn-glycerol-3-phosphate acyltransferase [Candidatus Pacearchaeota archaeon]
MELKRNDRFYNIARKIAGDLARVYHNIKYSGEENIPKEGPVLFVPKHRFYRDIVLEAILLHKACNRFGNWMMASYLPSIFEYCGAFKVARGKEAMKVKDRKKRLRIVEEGKKINEDAFKYVEFLYKKGEAVIVHPEGTRNKKKMGKISNKIFEFTRNFEKYSGIKIPVVPIGIEYKSQGIPRSKVYLRVGKPLDVNTPKLEEIVEKEIKNLSNL